MIRDGLVCGVAASAWLLSAPALAQTPFPETLRGCWRGHVGDSPALLQWAPQPLPGTGWHGAATLTGAEGRTYVERHTLTPPRPNVVNLGWRYCHPEREGGRAAERCYWMRGPSGNLEDHVTFDTNGDGLLIDSHAHGRTENLFRGARAPCPVATSAD